MQMPRDPIGADAAVHGRPVASRTDREEVIEVLKAAFVQGRLTKDELAARAGRAFTSRTCAELTEVTADLPAGLTGAMPPRQLARTRSRPSLSAVLSAAAFAMLAALLGLVAAIVSRSEIGYLIAAVGVATVGVLTFGGTMVASWHGRAR